MKFEKTESCGQCLTTKKICDAFLNYENEMNRSDQFVPRIHELISYYEGKRKVYFDFLMKQISREARGMFSADEFLALLHRSLSYIEECCRRDVQSRKQEIISEIFFVLEVVDKLAQTRLLPDEYENFKREAKHSTANILGIIFKDGLTSKDWFEIGSTKYENEKVLFAFAALAFITFVSLQ